MNRFLGYVFVAALSFATPALAEEMREVPVYFSAGADNAVLSDRIKGYDSVIYTIGAEAGQTIDIKLSTNHTATYFNLYGPGSGPGDQAIINSQFTPELNHYTGTLPSSGTYKISVYMMRSAARRDEVANFDIRIGITGKTGAIVQGDYADGLQGGPDFWQVQTGDINDPLNLRAGPSTGATILGRFPEGAILRNMGCRMAEGQRWCQVAATEGSLTGWVAGRYLREGSAPPPRVAEPETRDQQVQFAPGTSGAVLRSTLAPGAAVNYRLGARAKQFLTAQLQTGSPAVHFNIFTPDGQLLYESRGGRRDYRGQLWLNGENRITVYNIGDAPAPFTMIVGIE
ncbi:hypothetical protein BMG03_14225 [Thioclava nitratireducens]|uniref:SH3b domain-containing protein n=1 Tax=Thioclava nitratireducens TaxID=1915078 RepID=A0ABM6IJ02_9RHOB|nr:SH3 domain-containing protein [Thioclava nitratireducens]AQS48818.1 hypothetical protein BMG03_14225 [Thioclava nitratireducens]